MGSLIAIAVISLVVLVSYICTRGRRTGKENVDTLDNHLHGVVLDSNGQTVTQAQPYSNAYDVMLIKINGQ